MQTSEKLIEDFFFHLYKSNFITIRESRKEQPKGNDRWDLTVKKTAFKNINIENL